MKKIFSIIVLITALGLDSYCFAENAKMDSNAFPTLILVDDNGIIRRAKCDENGRILSSGSLSIANLPTDYFKQGDLIGNTTFTVKSSSNDAKVGAEILNWLNDFPDSALKDAMGSSDTNKNQSFQGGRWTIDNSSGTPAKVGLYIWNGTKWVEALSEGTTNHNQRITLYYGDKQVQVGQMASDGVSPSLYALFTKGHLYAFNGTTWDRLRSDELMNLGVYTSTNSHTQVDNFPTNYNTDGSSVTTKDNRFEGKTSSMTAGKIFTSTNLTPGDDVWGWYFYSIGGEASYTCDQMAGTCYIPDGQDDTEPGLDQPLSNPTFAITMMTGDTFYYRIKRLKE